jgi:2-dehydro-3-deoxygluconokinase
VFGMDEEPQRVAHQLASKWEFDTVIVTRGENGALALHDGVVHEQDAYETETTEPVGAGDAFAGAFLARRLDGDGVQDALAAANAAAALKRTIPGDLPAVTAEEVQGVVESGADREVSR